MGAMAGTTNSVGKIPVVFAHTGAYSPSSAGGTSAHGPWPRLPHAARAAARIDGGDRPYLANRYGAVLAPSAKVSRRPTRRNGRPSPASASTSATAVPRPPTTVWFSAVTTALAAPATSVTVAASSGLITGTFTTVTETPCASSTRAA